MDRTQDGPESLNSLPLIQHNANHFVEQYHLRQPSPDVGTLENLFQELPPKNHKRDTYEDFPLTVEYMDAPVRLVRVRGSLSNKDDPILDESNVTTYMIFLGTDEQAFAVLEDTWHDWMTNTDDGEAEPLSDDNKQVLKSLLNKFTYTANVEIEQQNQQKRARKHRRNAIIGTIAGLAMVAGGALGVKAFFEHGDEVQRQETEAFDASWSGRVIPGTLHVMNEVNGVTLLNDDAGLGNAPKYGVDNNSLAGPRRTSVDLLTGGCSTLNNVDLASTDKIAAVELSAPDYNDPIAVYPDVKDHMITFCSMLSFGDSRSAPSRDIVFQIVKAAK